jgi:hypothetical protein
LLLMFFIFFILSFSYFFGKTIRHKCSGKIFFRFDNVTEILSITVPVRSCSLLLPEHFKKVCLRMSKL